MYTYLRSVYVVLVLFQCAGAASASIMRILVPETRSQKAMVGGERTKYSYFGKRINRGTGYVDIALCGYITYLPVTSEKKKGYNLNLGRRDHV